MASSSSSSPIWKYDVFPSFHGRDVCRSFLSHLLMKELERKGINTFSDNEIARGNPIGPEPVRAIRGSIIAIVILPRNYASASWYLDELVEIMKCREDLGQVVIPIVYDMDPVDVKKQIEDLKKLYYEGETRKDDIARWRQALAKVGTIDGYDSSNWDNQHDMIEEIASNISNIVHNSIQSSEFDSKVGMEAHMRKMEALLGLDSDEVRMIGVCGPSGIGKTTIARFLFNQLSHQYQLNVFMEDIKGLYRSGCDEYNAKLQLQKDLLSQILNYKDIMIYHLGAVQQKLNNKKVLVVLDDVDSSEQLEALAKETRWFGPGSRIIITTQDKNLLIAHGINHIYKAGFPPPHEALQIFCTYAFGHKSPLDGFESLAWEVTMLSGGFPLKLKIMGSYFRGVPKHKWTNALPRLEFIIDLKGSISKDSTETKQKLIMTNKDLKEYSSTCERSFEDVVYIYCEDSLQYSFTSHLSMDFRRKRIDVLINCEETMDVTESLVAAVVIFSKNCFSSTSYLDMLVRVLQCKRKTGLVVPVFYGISPSNMMVQVQEEKQESADQIREWSSALQKLRELPGHLSREGWSEREFVENIVKDVYEKLFPAQQIGINSRLLEIEQLLCKQPWGIRRIGIWGMPGIGKTTLVKAFFDQISGDYEASCFIKHFDKDIEEKGLHRLLEEHFGKFLRELPRICSTITRPSLFGDKLNKKRTLVVLDDVHNPLVAESFLRGFHWFGPGSLIIITSRDKQVFRLCEIYHVYEVQRLNKDDVLQLFSHCVGKDIRKHDLLKLSVDVIDYTNGNPLALKVYGKELKGKKLSVMEPLFPELKLCTPYKIHDLFKSSYETLNDSEKNIFLDVACFFVGEDVEYVMQLLEGCGFFPHVGIDVLVDKCLVTILENRFKMHSLIQDVGQEIIKRETREIERRRRLWDPSSIKLLLENEELNGTEDIEGIFMDTVNLMFDLKPNAFENMINLRFLKIYCPTDDRHYGLRLPGGLGSLPCELRLLHWENYPLQSLTHDFDPCYLVELNMPHSQLHKLWTGTKNLKMLKVVRLCHSHQLTENGFLFKAPNVELIDLQGCTKLQSFPATCQLQHLRVVNISGCGKIKSLPEVSSNIEELHLQGTGIVELEISIGNATNLKKLYLSGCVSLVELPASIGNATNLKILDLGDCSSLIKLPSSIGNVTNLEELNLKNCSSLVELPSSIGNATKLKKLCLTGCLSLVDLPSSIENATNLLMEFPSSFGNATNTKILDLTNLKTLDLTNFSSLLELPSSIGNATNLEKLNLKCCSSLVKLPSSIKNATNLKNMCLTGCSSLVELPFSIGNAIKLQKLNLEYCSSLVELPSSIGNAINLKELYLTGCSSLVELPASIGNAINLEILDLGDCSSLRKLPSSIGNAINLEKLNLEYCLSLEELPSSLGNATNLRKLSLAGCSRLVVLPSSIGSASNLQELNIEYCSSLVELPSSFENAINLKKIYLTGCSSLVVIPSSIGETTSLISIDLNEDNHEPLVTFSDNSKSRCIEVRRAKRGNFFVLRGEQNDEDSLSLILRIVDNNGRVRNVHFLFYKEGNTASKVSSVIIKQLGLTDQSLTFIAELIDILLVNMIPTWKPDVTVDHFIHSLLNHNSISHQNEATTQMQEETAFNDTCESVSHSCPQPYKEDNQSVDAIKVEDGRSYQEAEDTTEQVRMREEEMLSQELEEIEAKYQEEMKKIVRNREEAIMETKKRRKIE